MTASMEIVERAYALPDVEVRLVYHDWSRPVDRHRVPEDWGLLDFGLLPRGASTRICFEDRWRRDRFEPVGELVFFPPGLGLRELAEPGRQRALQCRLSPNLLHRTMAWNDQQLQESLDLRAPVIRNTSMRIVNELRGPGPESPLLIEALIRLLVLDVFRHLSTLPASAANRGGLAPWQITRIQQRATLDGQPPSIDELAELCGLSRGHLMRGFKQSQRKSVGAYLEQLRLIRAKGLLGEGSAVGEVAFRLGFAHSTSFSTWFRRETGGTPRSYRYLSFEQPVPLGAQ